MSYSFKRRPLACHHESGHAFVRWYFGHPADRAIVLSLCEVRAGKTIVNRAGVHEMCEGAVSGWDICNYPFGPEVILGTPIEQAEHNKRLAIRRDMELINCYSGFCAEARYRRISYAGAMLSGAREDVAYAELIISAWNLSENDARSIADVAEFRARALVRSPHGSAAIKAIADVLISDGEILGDEISALCRKEFDGRECRYGAWSAHWPPTLKQLKNGYIPDALPPTAE